eukprot:TRINITY_DN11088_c0_g1_i3.p1 TRINITY_DN11088_c0_g1~~TRINITY_DN11088_c0_g1_i3.p1  ORF type:complete len:666 (+),score=99.92 TRINITY_DN11088_c0_g1_i3:114-2111(+)
MPRSPLTTLASKSSISTTDEPYMLRLTVHSCTHLLAKDLNATSDPYVKVSIDGDQFGRTSTKRGDLNPVFNETFHYELTSTRMAKPPQLKVEVFSEYYFGKMTGAIQNIGKQAFLGQIIIPLVTAEFAYDNPRQTYLLEKRSLKSHVRGSIELSIRLLPKSKFITSGPLDRHRSAAVSRNPSQRRRSYLSVGEFSEAAQVTGRTLQPGTYLLVVRLMRLTELLQVERNKEVPFHLTVQALGKKQRTKEYDLQLADDDDSLDLHDTDLRLGVAVRNPTVLSPLKITFVIVNQLKLAYALGHSTLQLGSIPVVEEETSEIIDHLMPLDLYIEKKKMKVMPTYLKHYSEKDRSICRLRLKAWLVEAPVADDDGDEEVDYDEHASKLEFEDDEFDDVELEPAPPAADLPAPYEWILVEDTVRLPATSVNKIMFSEHSPAFQGFCKDKAYSELSFTEWSTDHTRDFSYLIPRSSLVKANHAVEHQKYLVRSDKVFVIDIQTETPEVPFGASFVTQVQVRLQEAADGKSTRIKVTAQINFYKSVGMMKGIIQSSAKKGMTSTYELYIKNVRTTCHRGSSSMQLEAAQSEIHPEEADVNVTSSGRHWDLNWVRTPTTIIVFQAIVIFLLFLMWTNASIRLGELRAHVQRLEGLLKFYLQAHPEALKYTDSSS